MRLRTRILALATLGQTFGPAALAAADLDGDGDPDLVSGHRGANRLAVFWGGR